jgi:hypothetical protein
MRHLHDEVRAFRRKVPQIIQGDAGRQGFVTMHCGGVDGLTDEGEFQLVPARLMIPDSARQVAPDRAIANDADSPHVDTEVMSLLCGDDANFDDVLCASSLSDTSVAMFCTLAPLAIA